MRPLPRSRANALMLSWLLPTHSSIAVVFRLPLAERDRIPTVCSSREEVLAGGLMSYGTPIAEGFRQVGVYAGSILKGAAPADLPVVQSTKFELIVNVQTARLLSLDIPPTLFALADEVIE